MKTKINNQNEYKLKTWKNGLGKTTEMVIEPVASDFTKDDFLFRLSTCHYENSVHLSMFPNYDVTMIPLPDHTSVFGSYSAASLHHHDYETPVPIKTLIPYTYNGEWPTSCKVTHLMNALLFMSNRKKCTVQISVETIGCYGDACTNLMLLGNVTILYVVGGSIMVGTTDQQHQCVDENSTMVIERDHPTVPTDISLSPILRDVNRNTPSGDVNIPLEEQGDAIVVMIQITYQTNSSTGLLSPLLPPTPTDHPRLARTSTGSIIVFDDQPWMNGRDSVELASPTSSTTNLQAKFYDSAHHYKPPKFSDRFVREDQVPPAIVRDSLDLKEFKKGAIHTVWINMMKQGLSDWIRVPVIVASGVEEGPVVGITAVVHGNELNGVPCIHRVISDIDVSRLKGTVVAVPCVNVPGYLRFSREFSDGKDLNRYFPGKLGGTASQVYNHNFFTKIVKQLGYLIDLHTASFGRVNSYYVRADMNDPIASVFAKLHQPQIILHNSGQDGTFFLT
jgi:environmental stress-induced protein Ves